MRGKFEKCVDAHSAMEREGETDRDSIPACSCLNLDLCEGQSLASFILFSASRASYTRIRVGRLRRSSAVGRDHWSASRPTPQDEGI